MRTPIPLTKAAARALALFAADDSDTEESPSIVRTKVAIPDDARPVLKASGDQSPVEHRRTTQQLPDNDVTVPGNTLLSTELRNLSFRNEPDEGPSISIMVSPGLSTGIPHATSASSLLPRRNTASASSLESTTSSPESAVDASIRARPNANVASSAKQPSYSAIDFGHSHSAHRRPPTNGDEIHATSRSAQHETA